MTIGDDSHFPYTRCSQVKLYKYNIIFFVVGKGRKLAFILTFNDQKHNRVYLDVVLLFPHVPIIAFRAKLNI